MRELVQTFGNNRRPATDQILSYESGLFVHFQAIHVRYKDQHHPRAYRVSPFRRCDSRGFLFIGRFVAAYLLYPLPCATTLGAAPIALRPPLRTPGAVFHLTRATTGGLLLHRLTAAFCPCLLYTSDAADE